MTNFQLITILLSTAAMLTGQTTILILYINMRIAPIEKQINFLVQYMVEHSERIARLEEKTGITKK
jgi:hypothetical protein